MSSKKTVGLFCTILTVLILLAGCNKEAPAITTAEQTEESGQRLQISGTKNREGVKVTYSVSGTQRSVSVLLLDDATIELDGSPLPLQEAVEQGKVMPEEIAAWARLDAVDGYCEMTASSEKGLTSFLYKYDGRFTVRVVNDILESPDGKQHHIEEVEIYGSNEFIGAGTYYDDNGKPLAVEDWGISFAVEEVSSTGLTLVCTQRGGGHQVGALTLDSFVLYNADTADFVRKTDNAIGHEVKNGEEPAVIAPEETTRFVIDWTETIGEIPSGNYYMDVTVLDVFDRESVHPLLVKYQYSQRHGIEFSIPE